MSLYRWQDINPRETRTRYRNWKSLAISPWHRRTMPTAQLSTNFRRAYRLNSSQTKVKLKRLAFVECFCGGRQCVGVGRTTVGLRKKHYRYTSVDSTSFLGKSQGRLGRCAITGARSQQIGIRLSTVDRRRTKHDKQSRHAVKTHRSHFLVKNTNKVGV